MLFIFQLCIIFSFFAVSIVLFLVSRFSPNEWRSITISDTHLDHPMSSTNEVRTSITFPLLWKKIGSNVMNFIYFLIDNFAQWIQHLELILVFSWIVHATRKWRSSKVRSSLIRLTCYMLCLLHFAYYYCNICREIFYHKSFCATSRFNIHLESICSNRKNSKIC